LWLLCRIQTHLLAFEVYMRKRKLLLALAAVKGAHAAAPAPGDPDAHLVTVRFAQAVRDSTAGSDDQASCCKCPLLLYGGRRAAS